MKKLIWYAGGNSAGHIIPLRTLGEQDGGRNVFFTASTDLDYYLMRDYPYEHQALSCGALPSRWYHIPLFFVRFVGDCLRIARLLWHERPERVMSSGGFVAIPVVMVAWLARVPCDLFELNVVPGAAVKFLAPCARTIYYCFDDVKIHLSLPTMIGRAYPVRVPQGQIAPLWEPDAQTVTLVVLGGSQGSQFLNTFVPDFLQSWCAQDRRKIKIIHQAGHQHVTAVREAYALLEVCALVQPYFDTIEQVYTHADRVICRAGAGTLWELVHYKKPSLVIPLRTQATDHQVANARAVCDQYRHIMWLLEQQAAAHEYEKIKRWVLEPIVQAPVDHQAVPVCR